MKFRLLYRLKSQFFYSIAFNMSAKHRRILQVFLEETRESRTSFVNLDGVWENVFLMDMYLF